MITARPFRKARPINANDTDFPTWVATVFDPVFDAEPATAAGMVIRTLAKGDNGKVPCAIDVFPYGLGASNDAFAMRLVGYRRIGLTSDGRTQYLRFVLAVLTCTLGANVGLAGGLVLATELPCDTIVATKEGTFAADVTRTGSVMVYSPADDTPAHAVIPLVGIEAYQWEWDRTVNTPTMNALESFLDEFDA